MGCPAQDFASVHEPMPDEGVDAMRMLRGGEVVCAGERRRLDNNDYAEGGVGAVGGGRD